MVSYLSRLKHSVMVLGSFENLATNSAPDPLLPALLPYFSFLREKVWGGGMLGGTF